MSHDKIHDQKISHDQIQISHDKIQISHDNIQISHDNIPYIVTIELGTAVEHKK